MTPKQSGSAGQCLKGFYGRGSKTDSGNASIISFDGGGGRVGAGGTTNGTGSDISIGFGSSGISGGGKISIIRAFARRAIINNKIIFLRKNYH